jgi:hypothetical protein
VRTCEKGKIGTLTTDTPAPRASGNEPDVFCDGCGYSLIGWAVPRCPECGRDFDPKDLAVPQIPWLRRHRLGPPRAFLQTVAIISFRPVHFARQLSRRHPTTDADARLFRCITLRLATASFATVILMLPLVTLETSHITSPSPHPFLRPLIGLFFTALGISLFHLFIHLATAMPRFIWRDTGSTTKMYASAPLALLPLPGVALGIWFHILLRHVFNLDTRFLFVSAAISLVWIAWTCLTTVALAKASGQVHGRRLLILNFYLPLHWAAAFVACNALLYAVATATHFVVHLLLT